MSLKENELQETIVYSKSPRHGHGQDVVDDNGIRQVAGCLPIDPVSKRFLLVTSSSHQDVWVIPKGGWETDETQIQAAMRETWEEAGVKGIIQKHIGVFEEKTKHGVKAHHWIYELEIKEIIKRFPEQKKRERRWFTYDEAMLAVKAHYIKEAIKMSSISPVSNEKKKKKKKSKKKDSDDEDSESSNEKKDKKKKKNKKKDSEDEDSESSDKKKKKKKDSEDEDSESSDEKKDKKKKKNKKKDFEDEDSESSKEKKEKKDKKKKNKNKDSEDEDSESSREKKEKKDKKKKKKEEKKNKESEDDDSESSKEKKNKKKDAKEDNSEE